MMSQAESQLSQNLNKMNISNQQSPKHEPQKKLYEVPTTMGKLTIQITRFSQYIIIVITYSRALKLDGYLQIAHPTPYSDIPIVINIEKDEGQMDNEKLSQVLSKQMNCPVLLSFNIEQLNKGSEEEMLQVLRKILQIRKGQKE